MDDDLKDDMSLEDGLAYVSKSIKEIGDNYSGRIGVNLVKDLSTREIRIECIRLSVVDCSNILISVKKELLITESCKQWGCTRRTAQEYLTQLVAETSIFIDGEDVWSFEQWLKIEKSKKQDYSKGKEILQRNL